MNLYEKCTTKEKRALEQLGIDVDDREYTDTEIRSCVVEINEKINKNDEILKYSFYELRVKYNLTEIETERFLKLVRNRLFYAEYKTYVNGESYNYKGEENIVQDNELLIAIKTKKCRN